MSSVTSHETRVAIDALEPNPWNPNRMSDELFAKEMASIKRWGMVSPIIVRTLPGGKFQIIDGEQRWRAAQRLGMREVPIWDVGRMADADAKQLTIVLNELHGTYDPARMGPLLRDLLTSETTESLLEVLPWEKAEFAKLAELEPFDWPALDAEVMQQDGRQWVERIYRLPLKAAKVVDEAMSEAKSQLDDGTDWQALEVLANAFLQNNQPE
jgi:ParB-like chromosome segregation protein Spo0J